MSKPTPEELMNALTQRAKEHNDANKDKRIEPEDIKTHVVDPVKKQFGL